MEEKERYELFGEHCIKDNNPDNRCQLLSAYVACVILNEQDKHIKDLEYKLAERDKEIVRLNRFLQAMKIREHNQDKISFVVEQLEKVKEKFSHRYNSQVFISCESLLGFIDNKINELKGETK